MMSIIILFYQKISSRGKKTDCLFLFLVDRLGLAFPLGSVSLPLGVADAAEGGVLGETLEGGGVGVGKGF